MKEHILDLKNSRSDKPGLNRKIGIEKSEKPGSAGREQTEMRKRLLENAMANTTEILKNLDSATIQKLREAL